jgi:hypothetical protein
MKLKLKKRIIFTGKTKRTRRLVLVTLAGFCVFSAKAQQVVAPPPSMSVTPPAMAAAAPGEMQVFSPENPLSTFLDEVQPLQWGPVTLRPHVFYQFTYGTGILSGTDQQHDTVVQSFAPGILFVLSPRWTLDYTPTFTFYSDKNFKDSVGQSVTLTGGASYNEWVFGLSQNFSYSSTPQVQTGTQTSQDTYTTALTASYPLNSAMSVDLGFDQDLNFPSGFQSSLQWSTMDWLNYEFWPRLVVGIGAGAGYIDTVPNTVFEQLQGRINWRATDKISFEVSGGAEFSQFTEGGGTPLIDPIFGASIQYQPFEHTQISLNANEAVNTSYFQDQVNVTTTVGANLSQRLLEKFYLNVGGNYNWNDFTATGSDVPENDQNTSYYSINVGLSTTFFKRVSASIFYDYSDNTASQTGPQTGLGFSSHQIGFNVGYQY